MLGHRFQVLLDEERYQRVTALARERGVSTATIVQEAIDRSLSASHSARSDTASWVPDARDMRDMRDMEGMDVPADPADISAEVAAQRAPSARSALD
jgi:hypothetical protein